MGKLDSKVAMVTGASRGIGAAVARSLADAGANVSLASRSGNDLGISDAVALPTDVRDPDALAALVAATVDRFGKLDILIVNAGVGAYGPFLDLPADQMEEMIDVNVKGALYSIKAALPHLIESEAADIVTVASEAGRRGLPFEAVYSASKFAMVSSEISGFNGLTSKYFSLDNNDYCVIEKTEESISIGKDDRNLAW